LKRIEDLCLCLFRDCVICAMVDSLFDFVSNYCLCWTFSLWTILSFPTELETIYDCYLRLGHVVPVALFYAIIYAFKTYLSDKRKKWDKMYFIHFTRLPPASSAGDGRIGCRWADKRVMGGSGGVDGSGWWMRVEAHPLQIRPVPGLY